MIARIKKLGAFYLYGLAMFSLGAALGGALGLSVSQAVFVGLLKSRGLM